MGMIAHVVTNGCEKMPPEKWLQLLLMNKTVQHTLKFKPGCDLEGTVNLSRDPFPVDLAVRNVPDATRVKATITPEVNPQLWDREVRVTMKADGGKFVDKAGAELMVFSSVFKTTLGLDGKPKKKSACDIHITRYKGQKTDVHQTLDFH
jgi:hypothetical protein